MRINTKPSAFWEINRNVEWEFGITSFMESVHHVMLKNDTDN
jgi:hypothetical protein